MVDYGIQDLIVRDEAFPFVCQNPACGIQYDKTQFVEILYRQGLVYAQFYGEYSGTILQGITCPVCRWTNLIPLANDYPIVDLRKFIISPNLYMKGNVYEQVIEIKNRNNKSDLLRFQYLPAWDDKSVNFGEIERSYRENEHISLTEYYSMDDSIPYLFSSLEEATKRVGEEFDTGRIRLRRLYPDIPRFRYLLKCLSPNKITEIDFESQFVFAEDNTPKERGEICQAWLGLLEEAKGKSLKKSAVDHLRSRGYENFGENWLDLFLQYNLLILRYDETDKLRNLSKEIGFEEKIWKYLEKVFDNVFFKVSTEIALEPKREELLDWVNRKEEGKALFIDAPMGLGKTYSICKGLVDKSDLSAVIFMPTLKLCEEMVEQLKTKIAINKGIDTERSNYREQVIDEKKSVVRDEYGIPIDKWKREFLEDEVYFADGINEIDCPNFEEIRDRYRKNWIKKLDICEGCKKKPCRFLDHWKRAPLSRIVVTTHHQYDRFHKLSSIRKWYKGGYYKTDEHGNIIKDNNKKPIKKEGTKRDFFIVDEDLVLSRCYQPIGLDPKEVKDFSATVTEFLADPKNLEDSEEAEKIINKIDILFAKISMCDKTSVIPAIDREFRFPSKIKKAWDKSFNDQYSYIPEILDRTEIVGNHLEIIENAIRHGAVVQKYTQRDYKGGKEIKKEIYRAYFLNPKSYDLSRLPPHVFFDGTKIADEFLEKKLKNVKYKPINIKVEPLWQLRVYQNINNDLPQRWILRDMPKVKRFIRDLVKELGDNHQYFFITTKATREGYLDDFLKREYLHLKSVVVHYGNLKGINEAKECDVGIMLGSFIHSDAVEIAMALEFVQDQLPKNKITVTENNFWSWKGSKGQRVYKEDYSIVGKLAKSVRYSEQRQAIARTRYLFHNVDFYILSKDPVSCYEPFLSQVETEQYRSDVFQPRHPRSDNKKERVKEDILKYLVEYGTATEMEIHRKTGYSRTTLRPSLKDMLDKGKLFRDGKKYVKTKVS